MTVRNFTSFGQSRLVAGRMFYTSVEDGRIVSCGIDGEEVNAGEFQAGLEREGLKLEGGLIVVREEPPLKFGMELSKIEPPDGLDSATFMQAIAAIARWETEGDDPEELARELYELFRKR